MKKNCPLKLKSVVSSFYWLIPLLVGLDQLTKWSAASSRVNLWIIPNFFGFYYTRNTGAAFSIFADSLVALAIISALAGLAMFAYRILSRKKLTLGSKAIWSVIIAGTWGNFIDRAFYPEGVIDFIAFKFGSYQFPIFNLADSFLVCGAIALMIVIFIEKDTLPTNKDAVITTSENVNEKVETSDESQAK